MDFQINGQSQEFFTTVILSPELEKTSEQIWQIWGGRQLMTFNTALTAISRMSFPTKTPQR